jgi:D-methionine transport system substrate-binding protein
MKIRSLVLTLLFSVLTIGPWAADAPSAKKLVVGVAPGPYGDLFTKAIKPELEKKGYKIAIKEFSDYVARVTQKY